MGDNGIEGSKSGRMLRQGLLRLAGPTGKAADTMEELGINVFDAEGNMKSIPNVVRELSSGLQGMESDARTAAMATIFGSESTAGWSALLNQGADDLEEYSDQLQNSKGAAEEMAQTMEDNTNGAMREFRSAMEEAGIAAAEHMLPVFQDVVEYATEMLREFGELDESQQKQILKWAGIAAAAGPASVALGGITTTLSGITRAGSGLMSILGRTSGKGLIGRIGAMSMGGQVGLAVAGVGALGLGISKLVEEHTKLNDVSLESANKLNEQHESNQKMIDSFTELRKQSNLTNDQFARYVDLSSELESASDPKVIEDIKTEMEQLKSQSGFSNKELETMVELNGELADALPGATEEVTDQGEKIIGTRKEMEKYNQEIRESATLEMESEFQESAENYNKLLQQRDEIRMRMNVRKEYESELEKLLANYNESDAESLQEQLRLEREKLEEKRLSGDLSKTEKDVLNDQINLNGEITRLLNHGKGDLRDQLITMREQTTEDEKTISDKKQQLTQAEQIYRKLQMQYLTSTNINEADARKAVQNGNVLGLLDSQLSSLREQKRELDEQHASGQLNTQEYREQVGAVNDQIDELQTAKGQVNDLKTEARLYSNELSRDLTSNVHFEPDASNVYAMRAELMRPLTTQLHFDPNLSGLPPGFAKGTDSHKGGPAIVGEEGWELARHGNQWSVLNAGMYDLPRGTEIFTHGESKRMINAMNNIPAYASGVSAPGEANRIVNSLGGQDQQEVVGLLREISNGLKAGQSIYMDGREVGRQTFDHISEFLDREKRIEEQFR